MRRLQLCFDDYTDDELAAEAARRGVSKAALVRDLVRQGLQREAQDPIDSVIGLGYGQPVEDIEVAVYGTE